MENLSERKETFEKIWGSTLSWNLKNPQTLKHQVLLPFTEERELGKCLKMFHLLKLVEKKKKKKNPK